MVTETVILGCHAANMNFVPRIASHVIRPPEPRWYLTASALIGQTNHGRIAYGRWDKQFGAWIENEEAWLPFSPSLPLFNHRGVWQEPDGERTDAWYEERAMKAAYFSLIPTFIRRLAATKRDHLQWSLLWELWHRSSQPHPFKEK